MLLQVLLQVVTPTSNGGSAGSASDSKTFWELFQAGGLWMYPIAALSVVALYIIIERLISLKKADKDPDDFLIRIRTHVHAGDISGAMELCRKFDTPFSRMIEKGISKLGTPLHNIEASIENVGKIELYRLERNISILATVSGAAPMLGFLGTVIGMVQVFMDLNSPTNNGSVSVNALSGGIYVAMLTTVAGLIVGILAYIGYNYLVSRVDKIVHKMEYTSIEFIEILQQPKA